MKTANDFALWQRPYFEMLSSDQLAKVYEASLELLERVGGDFYDDESINLLADAGAHVQDNRRVRIPSHLVERALRSAPQRVVISNRNGKRTLFLEGRNIYFGTGSDTPFVLDPHTGQRRKAMKADVGNAARIVDTLPDLDFCMSSALANDVNEMTSDGHHFEAMVKNTVKPLIITSWSLKGLQKIYEMMVAVKGTEKDLEMNPFVIVFLMAISPLRFPKESLQKLLFCAEKRIPLIWTSGCPTMGSTAPIWPAGAFVVDVAEFLAGLVLSQLKNPGCPVIAGCCGFGSLDMRTGLRPYNSPEQDFGHICGGEMARYLRLPSWGVGGTSDSKVLDEQAVAQAYQKLFLSAISGANLIHDVGYLDNGLTTSLDLLTICQDFIAGIRRFLRSFVISKETLGVEAIEKIGPGGDFLTQPDTLQHFKQEIWMPELIDQQSYPGWAATGKKTLKQRANEKIKWMLDHYEPERLPASVEKYLSEVTAAYDRQGGKG